MSAACHRSLYGYQLRTALALAIENKQVAVTFLPLACTGATIESGLFGSQGASDCPPTGRCAGTVPPQIEQLQDLLDKARKQHAEPQARSRAAHRRRQRHQILRPRRRRHHQRRRRAHAVQPGRPACHRAAGAGAARPRISRQFRQAPQRAEAAGRRQPVPRRLRVLRPSGDAGRRALPRRPRRARHPSGVHRRRHAPEERHRLRADEVSAEGEGAGALRGGSRNAPTPTPTA